MQQRWVFLFSSGAGGAALWSRLLGYIQEDLEEIGELSLESNPAHDG